MPPLDVVLLGAPSAGKSSLLGALYRAAQADPKALGAKLDDVDGELARLAEQSQAKKPTPTRDPVEPVSARIGSDVRFLDTNGAEAQRLLANAADAGPAAKAVAGADGVVVVVDASASSKDLERQFAEVVGYLKALQNRRSAAIEVSGLPLFLVLSKCDRIARDGESLAQWMQRIEEAKRRVGEQFRQAMASAGAPAFGGLDVRVWATATQRPTDADRPGRAQAPYQVAELFRQCVSAARAFRERRERSFHTLHAALTALGAVAIVLAALVGWYALTQPTLDQAALETRVQALLGPGQTTNAELVREPLADRLAEIAEIKNDAAYASLAASLRSGVDATEAAIREYQALRDAHASQVRSPRLATREADLALAEKILASFDAKVAAWPDTRLAKRHAEWKDEARALRTALADEEAWVREQLKAGERLREAGGLVIAKQLDAVQREAWFAQVHAFLDQGRRHKGADRVAGTQAPYRNVYQFDRYEAVEREWHSFKERLSKLREEALSSVK